MAFFSIIIPLYNKENFIESTLKSIFSQTFTDFEIIIVNDGSTDKSEEKVQQFNDCRIRYFTKENGGVSTARNFGIENAETQYITFIDADDYWFPNFLQVMFENINKYPEHKIFSAAIEIETSKIAIPARYSIIKTNDCENVNFFQASLKQPVLFTSCAVFHKSVFEKIGQFDVDIESGQDLDLWIRMGLVYPILFSWKILARYVDDSKSLSKSQAVEAGGVKFTKFKELEKSNPNLKKILDLNRFTIAIKCKLSGNHKLFKKYYKSIDTSKLSVKKRILLLLPAHILKPLIRIKAFLVNLGIGNTVFK